VLLDEARGQGLIGKAPADRLTFCAMAAHALRVSEDNPCGLFASLLHDDQLRLYLSDADDEDARVRLNAHEYGIDLQRQAQPPSASDLPLLSQDAWCVRELQRELTRQGMHVDVLAQLQRQDPARWTDEHCQIIARELAHYTHASQSANALSHLGELAMQGDCRALPFPEDLECSECGEVRPLCAC
jgi:hypothetical protein